MDESENTQEKSPKTPSLKCFPTSTVTQARVNLFAPSKFTNKTHLLKHGDQTISTKLVTNNSWGECEVIGVKLSQVHKSALEAVITCHKKLYRLDTGDIAFFVRLPDVLNIMNLKTHHNVFYGLLKDMEMTCITLTTKKFKVSGHIVQGFGLSKIADPKVKKGALNINKNWSPNYFYITIGKPFLEIYQQDLSINYPGLVYAITRLRYGVSMAAVRFLFTQSRKRDKYTINCDTLLIILGAINKDSSSETRSRIRLKLKSEADSLAELGITFDENKISFNKPHGLFF